MRFLVLISPLIAVLEYILTFIVCILISYLIVNSVIKRRQFYSKLYDFADTKSEIKKIKNYYSFDEKKDFRIIVCLKNLILRANIRNSFITPYMLLGISILIFFISILTLWQLFFWLQAAVLSAFISAFPEIILYFIAEHVNGKMNKAYVDFLNLLENFLEVRDDINFAMEKIAKFNTQLPIISDYCRDYVFDISHGNTPMTALQHFSDKVDNIQIKNLLMTLISCNVNTGKYLKIVKQTKINYMELYDKLLERKKEAHKNRISILLMMIIFFIILIALFIINGDVYYTLTHTPVGIIIFTGTIVSFIITFFVAVNVGHFNFD